MNLEHSKTHNYRLFADQYAQLGLVDTYYLKFRDIPLLLKDCNVSVGQALDHGCGTGLSTRFVRDLGFSVEGIDKTESMLVEARQLDPSGVYHLISDLDLSGVPDGSKQLIFQSSVLEEYPTLEAIGRTCRAFHRILKSEGFVAIATVSEQAPKGKWITLEYPSANLNLKSGDRVQCKVKGTDIEFSDYFWTDADYRKVFTECGFDILKSHHPLGYEDEPFRWVDEGSVSPWSIYILKKI